MAVQVVAASDLGTDFDLGDQETEKINVIPATTSKAGKMRFATSSEFADGMPGVTPDATQVRAEIVQARAYAIIFG